MTATSDKQAGGGSTTATTSGTVKYKFVWESSGPGDNAPSTVVIMESATASWWATDERGQLPRQPPQAASGSGSATIGDIPVTKTTPQTSPAIGESKTGIRFKVMKTMAGEVEVTGTLYASATVSSGSNFGAHCQASCNYSASIGTVRLRRDGADITDANRDVLPGQKITLTVSGADASSTYSWQKPSYKPFASYDITKTSSQLDTNIGLSSSSLHYYYAYGNDAKDTISCAVSVGGEKATVEDELIVEKIDNHFFALAGHVVVNSSAIVLAPNSSTGFGISWQGSYAAPVHGSGTIGIFQFIKPSRFAKVEVNDTAEYKLIYNNIRYADSRPPVWTFPCPAPIPVNGAGDAPRQPYTGRVEAPPPYGIYDPIFHQVAIRNESFESYLMFLPSDADSCWVPLKLIKWSWSGTSTFDGIQYTLSSGVGPAPTNEQEKTDHPTWDNLVDLKVTGRDVLWKL